MTKKEKLIVAMFSIVFLLFLISVFYNFYNKNIPSNNTEKDSMINNKNINDNQKKENSMTNEISETNNDIEFSSYSTCLENTKSGPDAKDCCDCLDADLSVRKACRDATVSYDFSKNTVLKTFEIPSILGANGDYSLYTMSGNQLECKQQCEAETTALVCGDFQFCRTACNELSQ